MRVELLGRFAVVDEGRDMTPTALPAQALKLVACRGGRMHWEELVEALWPSVTPRRGRTRLRNVLSRLRMAAGPLLVRQGNMVLLAPGARVDAEEFERAAREAATIAAHDPAAAVPHARAALELYRGELLPEDRYAFWTEEPRERLRRRFRAVVDLLVQDAQRRGDREGALVLLERLAEAEPDAEEVHLDAAELLAGLGRRAAALRMVARARALAEEAGLPPSERSERIERELRRPEGGQDDPGPGG